MPGEKQEQGFWSRLVSLLFSLGRQLLWMTPIALVFAFLLTVSVYWGHPGVRLLTWPLPQGFFVGIVIGFLLSFALLRFASKGAAESFAPLKYAITQRMFLWFLIPGLLLVFICIVIATAIEPLPEQGQMVSWWRRLVQNPGGIFAIVTGLATVYALLLTWRSLTEFRQSITSFSELIDRLPHVAATATDDDPLRIIANTPAVGYLARPERDWHRVFEILIKKREGKPSTQIICLRAKDLERWHRLFEGRRTHRGEVTRAMTDSATQAAENVLKKIGEDDQGNSVPDSVKRLPLRSMPGFFTFFTRKRAMVVAPLFLPFPEGVQRSEQESLPTVQMVGLETQDRAIIRDLEFIYDYYKSLPDHPLADGLVTVEGGPWANGEDAKAVVRNKIMELANQVLTNVQSDALSSSKIKTLELRVELFSTND